VRAIKTITKATGAPEPPIGPIIALTLKEEDTNRGKLASKTLHGPLSHHDIFPIFGRNPLKCEGFIKRTEALFK